MEANKTILQMKYARIVKLFSKQSGISLENSLESSTTRMYIEWSARALLTCTAVATAT